MCDPKVTPEEISPLQMELQTLTASSKDLGYSERGLLKLGPQSAGGQRQEEVVVNNKKKFKEEFGRDADQKLLNLRRPDDHHVTIFAGVSTVRNTPLTSSSHLH
ncbi:Digestive organ expansion factor [Oryzias melastigma]|uniref:Digestive organ expansion factor n=1 Tax=Oryzias melastigma TaxID=30732 RepID=A0A834FNV2_ORYME|nr:Digestive organ expansion factor [Oryzias melastigma]